MSLLQRIRDDIRRGENIDLYATVVVALGLATLNIIGLAPQKWIAPLTLIVLGLIAVSTLGNRHRVEGLMRKLTLSVDSVFLSESPPSIKSDFETAEELWLVGVTLSRTIKTYYSVIEQMLGRGHTVNVLLVNPAGSAVVLDP